MTTQTQEIQELEARARQSVLLDPSDYKKLLDLQADKTCASWLRDRAAAVLMRAA